MRTLFLNALVFDGHKDELIADRQIGIENGRIVHFAAEAWEAVPDRTIDLAGKVLMPGLIDAHFHAYGGEDSFPFVEELPFTYLAHKARNFLEDALKRGFTSVRDAAGADYGLWRAVEQGAFVGPRVFFGGRALSQTGGHGDVRPAHVDGEHGLGEPCQCKARLGRLVQVIDGVEGVRKAAREILRQGAHQIKIMASGGIASPTDPTWMTQYSEEEIRAIVEEARRWRRYVMAHAYTPEAISRSVRFGVRTIEHGNFIDRDAARDVVAADAYVVPTLSAYYDDPANEAELASAADMGGLAAFRRAGLDAIRLCRGEGVKLGFGTDLFGSRHGYQAGEFKLRGEVETPFQVLHSATAVNAEIVQRANELGCVRIGALADLIVVDGNPLEDLAVLHSEESRIALVMKGGEIVHAA